MPVVRFCCPCVALLGAALLAPGCPSPGDGTAEVFDSIADTGTFVTTQSYLRVDVFPSDQNGGLLPQTVFLDETWTDLEIDLLDPISLSGHVTGFDATPHATVSVPGETVPVVANVSAWRDGTVMSGATISDSQTGAYELLITPGVEYTFAVVPEDPSELPFQVETSQTFAASHSNEVQLDYAAPVFGRVTSGQGASGLAGIHVELTEPLTGVTGASDVTDAQGWYLLRATPGRYIIRFHGSEGSYIPTLSGEVVFDTDAGARVDEDYASLQIVTAQGLVTTIQGNAESNATVRFTSLGLDAYSEGSLVVETDTDRNGRFSVNVLPGEYRVEYIPTFGREVSPLEDRVDILSDQVVQDLGERELQPFTSVHLQIRDADGVAVPNVMVVASETAFENDAFRGTSDAQGVLVMDLPDTTLNFTFTPQSTGLVAVTRLVATPAGLGDTVELDVGRSVTGTVLDHGVAVSYAVVELRDENDGLYASTITAGDGTFSTRVAWEAAR
jgi:hypothetical protein